MFLSAVCEEGLCGPGSLDVIWVLCCNTALNFENANEHLCDTLGKLSL